MAAAQRRPGKSVALRARHDHNPSVTLDDLNAALSLDGPPCRFGARGPMRRELTAALGVEWGPVHEDAAEIAGVPHAVLREFSQRVKGLRSAKPINLVLALVKSIRGRVVICHD